MKPFMSAPQPILWVQAGADRVRPPHVLFARPKAAIGIPSPVACPCFYSALPPSSPLYPQRCLTGVIGTVQMSRLESLKIVNWLRDNCEVGKLCSFEAKIRKIFFKAFGDVEPDWFITVWFRFWLIIFIASYLPLPPVRTANYIIVIQITHGRTKWLNRYRRLSNAYNNKY